MEGPQDSHSRRDVPASAHVVASHSVPRPATISLRNDWDMWLWLPSAAGSFCSSQQEHLPLPINLMQSQWWISGHWIWEPATDLWQETDSSWYCPGSFYPNRNMRSVCAVCVWWPVAGGVVREQGRGNSSSTHIFSSLPSSLHNFHVFTPVGEAKCYKRRVIQPPGGHLHTLLLEAK